MANWSNLKTAISNVVKSNGIQGITGDSLQSVMLNMVTKLGENYMFAGVATLLQLLGLQMVMYSILLHKLELMPTLIIQ